MTAPPVQLMCFACQRELSDVPTGPFECACGERYVAQPMRLQTESDKHLFRMYGKKFLLNKVLNNNGFISYSLFPEGNVSVPDRQDVIRFRKFIQSEVPAGSILDIGCGPLPLAGYLRFTDERAYSFIGLDPIDGTSHEGYRIVGASELIPLRDRSVDGVVFGTSLDHVCDLKRSIREARRVVKDDGRILVWMGDASQPLRKKIRAWLGDMRASLRLGYPVRRYKVYRNFMVLEVPRGAIDPFHSHLESPKKIIREFEDAGCRLVQHEFHSTEEHFMSFSAGRPLTPAR